MFARSPQDDVDLRDLQERVARLEAAVAALQAQLSGGPTSPGPVAEPAFMAEVRALKAQGKVIHAIKVYREHTGVGLKQAKDTVEALV